MEFRLFRKILSLILGKTHVAATQILAKAIFKVLKDQPEKIQEILETIDSLDY